MNLNISDWKEFKLSSICDVINGKGVTEEEIENYPGELYAIQGGASNNGCLGKISEEYCKNQRYKVITENCLTVARVGSAGVVNFQGFPCVVGDKAKALILKEHKTTAVYVFIATLLNQNVYKYSYGRGLVTETYMSEILKLPICKDKDGQPVIDNTHKYSEKGYIPDFDWMENYIKTLNYQPLTTSNGAAKLKFHSLGVENWKDFLIADLFDIKTGKDFIYNEAVGDEFAVIGHGVDNNGVACKTEKLDDYILQDASKTISLGHIGNFVANVHPKDFYLGTRTKALISKEDNISKEALLFLATILNNESYKYSYGRVGSNKFQDTYIKLPIQFESDGKTPIIDRFHKYSKDGYLPDFNLMTEYIKSLPYGDRI